MYTIWEVNKKLNLTKKVMDTVVFKQSFLKSQTWKIIFLVLDSIMYVVSYPIFFFFALIFQNHESDTKWGFYGPMLLLLGFILAMFSWCIYNYSHLSWFSIVGIDILLAIVLIICVCYPMWSNDYREKMGYRTRF